MRCSLRLLSGMSSYAQLSHLVPRSFPDSRYILSTHVVPAAHLRSTPPSTRLGVQRGTTRENAERVAWVKAQAQRPRGRHERVLWSAVNRYTRKDVTQGTELETWEPTILDLLAIPNGPAVHHGARDWANDARDVLNFLLHFLPSSISGSDLPTFLLRVAPEESQLRKVRGFSERKLFAVGHSFGGCCWLQPRLFTSLTLVDPVIIRHGTLNHDPRNPAPSLMEGAVARRDTWPSREEAHKALAANPFFAAWDPRVLDAYVAHGLVAAPDGRVQLAMPGIQEALAFEATSTSAPVWDLLPTLEDRIPLRFVVPGRPGEPEIGDPNATQERVWRRPANSSNIRIASAGHLIVQQAPSEMAREIAGMVEGRFARKQAKL
ncbi:hypothetical protein K438DRAFT_1805734 [Mycena galopus ATCC 62051]|nr:hypothetical protein K438DRAFT_1805734 [Mycena galopus ATCC 62051]